MFSEHHIIKLFKASLISCFIAGASLYATPPLINYSGPMGSEKWKMTGSPLRCGLSLTIPNYGIGYFEQYATKPPHFILRKWEEIQRNLPAFVLAKSQHGNHTVILIWLLVRI